MALRFRVTHKIAAIGLNGILGLLLVGGIYLAGNAAQDRYRQTAADAQAISSHASKLFIELLEARRAEKDFLLRHDVAYATKHAALVKSISGDIDGLRSRAQAAGQADLDRGIEAIRAGFND